MRRLADDMNASVDALSAVSTTALLTLFGRAQQSRSARPLLRDRHAEDLADQLTPLLAEAKHPLVRQLAKGRLPPGLDRFLALRARHFDARARDFVERHPAGLVVNLACGFDTRFARLDDGRVRVVDVDLPPVIALKRTLVEESDRYRFLGRSVLEPGLEEALPFDGRPIIFLAEGLFMYLREEQVRHLVRELDASFPGGELVAELFNGRWLAGPMGAVTRLRMRVALRDEGTVAFRYGPRDARELEAFGPGVRFMDEWSIADEADAGFAYRLMRYVDALRRSLWVARYALGANRR